MKLLFILLLYFLYTRSSYAKEVALTFDDSPNASSLSFKSEERVKELIRKLKALHVPAAIIFANPCKNLNVAESLQLLKLYKDAGHIIGNHTCTPQLAFEKTGKKATCYDYEAMVKDLNKVLGLK